MTQMTISKHDYLKVVGLLALVDDHMKSLVDIEKSLCSILGGEFNEGGHISDMIYGFDPPRRATDLLKKMEIEVTDAD